MLPKFTRTVLSFGRESQRYVLKPDSNDSTPEIDALDSAWDDEETIEPALADVDAGWDLEEERVAAAADVASGLGAGARRRAAEERAAARKEKQRAKKLAAQEKRRTRSDAVRQKQKKAKKKRPPSSRQPGAEPRTSRPGDTETASLGPSVRRSATPSTAKVRRRSSVRILLLLAAFAVSVGIVAVVLARS
jgi:hypothetical protein